ncbi:pilin [Aerolutibacter ruishenii]|uniref:Type IV pilus assembly protein PilA n=1 Tax=Aerolutibacter ruishenii TaxID=686800 RepID=A0A562M2L9_9GAMM|nr:pilin [Lysobacter ruishenii]TWI14166.1 type IV pilus assembly protein PilA [Lysobacter ruishenii]
MKKNMQGFTLIELMIVVAIIAILMAIAIPAYQDYTVRARVSEAVNLVAPAKLSVAEYTQDKGSLPTDSAAAGYTSASSKYVSGIAIANGVITVTLATSADLAGMSGQTLTFTPNWTTGATRVDWSCSIASNTNYKYVPATCRNTTASSSASSS